MRRNEFAGRGAVIVGADVGLGPAIVQAFTEADMQIATDGAAAHGVGTVPSQGAEPASISAFFDAALRRVPSLDVLVLAARPVTIGKFLEVSAAQLRSVIEEELVWFALIMQEGARRMIPNGRGRIISLSSMSGKTGVHPNVGPYAAAKGGLIALSRVMAAELGGTGITVNVIANALMQPPSSALVREGAGGGGARYSGRTLWPAGGGSARGVVPGFGPGRLHHRRDAEPLGRKVHGLGSCLYNRARTARLHARRRGRCRHAMCAQTDGDRHGAATAPPRYRPD
jgi:NAD(P)-dependent dehydrogenase (short-subunit alcohol dehydrogenase family)